jgi:hypothetical protein
MILGVDKLVAIIDAAKLNQTFHLNELSLSQVASLSGE